MSTPDLQTDTSNTAVQQHPPCPMLGKDHRKWLIENHMVGFIQNKEQAQAKLTTGKPVRGPGVKYVRKFILNDFIDAFWTHENEPNTASVFEKVTKNFSNHCKDFINKSQVNPCTQLPVSRHTNTKEQFHHDQKVAIKEKMRTLLNGSDDDKSVLHTYYKASCMLWNSLTKVELEKYEAMAKEKNNLLAEGPALTDVYKMQKFLLQGVEAALFPMIGFGHNQFGKIAFWIDAAYQNVQGLVEHVVFKVHSASKTWKAIPDNDLQSKDQRAAFLMWVARGFDADKEMSTHKQQKTISNSTVAVPNTGEKNPNKKSSKKSVHPRVPDSDEEDNITVGLADITADEPPGSVRS